MYKFISVFGSLIRQFFLPNPFIALFPNQQFADIFNLVVGGPVIGFLSYILIGYIYKKNSAPALGSLFYSLAYASISALLSYIPSQIKNIYFALAVFLVIYIILCLLLSKHKTKSFKL
jgi:hypothetical protein